MSGKEPPSTIGSMARILQLHQTWAGCYTAPNKPSFNLVSCTYRIPQQSTASQFCSRASISDSVHLRSGVAQLISEQGSSCFIVKKTLHGAGQMLTRRQKPGKLCQRYLVAPHSLGMGYLHELDAQDNWSDPGSYERERTCQDTAGMRTRGHTHCHGASSIVGMPLTHRGYWTHRGSHSTWSVILLLGRFHISHSLQPAGLHASGRHGNRQGNPR